MRNSYSNDFKQEIIELAPSMTLDELLEVANSKYHYSTTRDGLRKYLSRNHIRYKGYNFNKYRRMCDIVKVGTERVRKDGMIEIKVSPTQWEYKQRYIYKQYHNVELTENDFIIFLDHDRTNFDINNLKRISRQESSVMANKDLFSTVPELTETGIDVAKLVIKADEKEKEYKYETNN